MSEKLEIKSNTLEDNYDFLTKIGPRRIGLSNLNAEQNVYTEYLIKNFNKSMSIISQALFLLRSKEYIERKYVSNFRNNGFAI